MEIFELYREYLLVGRQSNASEIVEHCTELSLPLTLMVALCLQVPIFMQGNLGFALTLRRDGACHIHLASSPVWVCLSPASYWHIIDMCTGMLLLHACMHARML